MLYWFIGKAICICLRRDGGGRSDGSASVAAPPKQAYGLLAPLKSRKDTHLSISKPWALIIPHYFLYPEKDFSKSRGI